MPTTVLLVDDSPVVRRVLTRRLVSEGFEVRAEGTAGAVRDVDPELFACAVVDIELPDGSGYELASELLLRRPLLRVAFYTAGASPEILDRAREHGPVFWKPDLDELVAWVKNVAQPPPTK